MSVESWARRASGLLVPTFGLDAPWKYSCFGCGCGGLFCQDCFQGTLPSSVWIDIPALIDDGCADCEWYEQTYELPWNPGSPGACRWRYDFFDLGPCGVSGATEVEVQLYAASGQCWLLAAIGFGYNAGVPETLLQWRVAITKPTSSIDHVLPYDGRLFGTLCGGTGTTVHVY